MATSCLKILLQFDFPSQTIRLWDGSGPYVDGEGNVWAGTGSILNLDQVELALNGVATTLVLQLSGVDPDLADLAWADTQSGDVIGSKVTLSIQPCDEAMQPSGDPKVKFTGTIDNIVFDDGADGDTQTSAVTIEVVNRFNLRRLTSGSVLSETDQAARAKVLNPEGATDKFADRVAGLADKTLNWPDW